MNDTVVTLPERAAEPVPPLEAGDHLDQKTFHERYQAMPPGVRAELIAGVVYMPSPLKPRHGRNHQRMNIWLGLYSLATPGTDILDNTTSILGEYSEPQPDASLAILPECGGQTHDDENGNLIGAPELIVEVALSSAAYDLHEKRRDYEQAGAREYIVLVLRENRIVWWVRRGTGFELLELGSDGVYRSECFPGLWLDPAALLRNDMARVQEVLQLGLASPEHQAFVEILRRP